MTVRLGRRDEIAASRRPRHPVELDTAARCWQLAFDASDRALSSAVGLLSDTELQRERHAVAAERQETAATLARLARLEICPTPWLPACPVTSRMLGLGPAVRACLFDLDGVLTDSGVLHARAWAAAFDPLLLQLSEQTGWPFVPFDPHADYRAFVEGRPRLEGVQTFLESRGIHLPEGRARDPAGTGTASGLAAAKRDALGRDLIRRGLSAVPGARRYLEASGFARLERCVVSASTRTLPMLELAGLATLVESRVDAEVIRGRQLRSRPAPDILLAACAELGVSSAETVSFTHTPAGVVAGRAAGLTVVGIASGREAEELSALGAHQVASSLGSLLDHRLAA